MQTEEKRAFFDELKAQKVIDDDAGAYKYEDDWNLYWVSWDSIVLKIIYLNIEIYFHSLIHLHMHLGVDHHIYSKLFLKDWIEYILM